MPSSLAALVAERAGRLPMDEPAFVAFYARTAEPLKGYLRRLTGHAAVAEDLLQDAFVRFLASGRMPDTDDHRRNYLFRIATNLARDYFRSERRRRDGDVSQIEAADRRACAQAVAAHGGDAWALLSQLSPRDRELLVLAYVEGMTHREIASVTGLVTASVKPLLFRARRRYAILLTSAGLADRRAESTP